MPFELPARFDSEGTNAHRLYSGGAAWLERFGEDLLLSYKEDAAADRIREGLSGFAERSGLVWRRLFGKFIPRQNQDRIAPVLFEGDASLPMETVVREGGMSFGLDFAAGYSAGLFIDQRANRALVRRLGNGKLLNTFAYTCSFSVAAAVGGAQTTSIDLSKKSIARGRENFRLNQLKPEEQFGHRFYSDDVLDVMPWLVRRKESYDIVILDPPTFSRGNGGRRFQVETGLEELMRLALELAAPNAKILLSSNCTRMNRRALEAVARFALKAARRAGDLHGENPLPDVPEALGAQTLWVFLRC